jgi:tellurite resistance protein
VLVAAKGLPFVGKYLLQRTVIKVAIPVVGIPIATGMNYWTTLVAGRNAQKIFRNEGRISELAERLLTRSDHPQLLLWVSWLIVNADSTISEDETRLFQFLTRFARERQDVADEKLAAVIDIEPAEVWTMIAATDDDMEDIISASQLVASVDGDINAKEQALLDELKIRCRAE